MEVCRLEVLLQYMKRDINKLIIIIYNDVGFFRCEHWDVVNNMFEVDNFLTDIYGSDKIIAELYQRSKKVDYAAKLFVNHIGLVESSIHKIGRAHV